MKEEEVNVMGEGGRGIKRFVEGKKTEEQGG